MRTREKRKRDLPGDLAIPLQKGQVSCRDVKNGERLVKAIGADQPLMADHISGPYGESRTLRDLIRQLKIRSLRS